MKAISGKDFAKLIEKHGWKLLHIQGSHHIYGKAGERCSGFRSDSQKSTVENRTFETFIKTSWID